jgi:hypothetical protein
MTGAPQGRNLAALGYSYDFVARAFTPLLERWGRVIEVPAPERYLEAEVRRAQRGDLLPVHVAFRALQHAWLSPSVPNVVVPAWEFPDVPDHAFDGEPRNDWVQGANRCALVMVGGPFTAEALRGAGVRAPIQVVPVPVGAECFEVPAWDPRQRTLLDCPAYVFPAAGSAEPDVISWQPSAAAAGPGALAKLWARVAGVERSEPPDGSVSGGSSTNASRRCPLDPGHPTGSRQRHTSDAFRLRWQHAARELYKRYLRPWVPSRLDRSLVAAQKAWSLPTPHYRKSPRVELSGVVYTSIFTPGDARKNWQDLLSGFLLALRDREDATLVVKLIAQDAAAAHPLLEHYRQLDLSHRCRLVVITDFLSPQQMLALTEASTYYLTTTRAEGNCLPLMNYLAAGRPGISPCHTAIGDYFGDELGYVVASHPEPAAWPQDRQMRCRTSWHRLVWPSLVEQLRVSYLAAKQQRAVYQAKAACAREKMLDWAGPQQVWPRLHAALSAVLPSSTVEGAASRPLLQRSAA